VSHSTVEKQRRDRINSLIDEVRPEAETPLLTGNAAVGARGCCHVAQLRAYYRHSMMRMLCTCVRQITALHTILHCLTHVCTTAAPGFGACDHSLAQVGPAERPEAPQAPCSGGHHYPAQAAAGPGEESIWAEPRGSARALLRWCHIARCRLQMVLRALYICVPTAQLPSQSLTLAFVLFAGQGEGCAGQGAFGVRDGSQGGAATELRNITFRLLGRDERHPRPGLPGATRATATLNTRSRSAPVAVCNLTAVPRAPQLPAPVPQESQLHMQLSRSQQAVQVVGQGITIEEVEGGCLDLKVNCMDRPGLLSDIMMALRSMPLDVSTLLLRVHFVYMLELLAAAGCACSM
jgi:hypothetical protein